MNKNTNLTLSTIIIITISLFLHSCHPASPLESALERAGKNRPELEKALTHFARLPEDSLKYKAVCFLIENMPGHTSLNEERAVRHFDSLRRCSTADNWLEWKISEQMYLRHIDLFDEDAPLTEDVETLTAKQLIAYIESVFKQTESCPWLQETTFGTFCEYLLPYRLHREHTLLYRDSIPPSLSKAISDARLYDDCRMVIAPLGQQLQKRHPLPYFQAMKKLPGSIGNHSSDCRDNALGELLLYRLAGIPAALDMTPAWGNSDGNHAWAHPIDARFHSRYEVDAFNRDIPKVYRQTYSRQHADITPAHDEFVPPFFRDVFLKDVTHEYVNTADVTEKHFPESVRYGYLCVFNEQEWKPVAQAENHQGTCTFACLGTNCLYLPVYYENAIPIPVANPFILTANGNKQRITADGTTADITLQRKYPLEKRKENHIRPFNCLVEGSNSPDFRHCDTLGCVAEHNPTYAFRVQAEGRYRFIRFSPFRNTISHIAEIYFKGKHHTSVTGKADRTNIHIFPAQRLTDNNILTPLILSEQITYAFPKDSLPTSIDILPATDGNGIYPGDTYELFYFDLKEGGWVTCGAQKADDYQLTFRHVPEKALFWLQNLTTGKQERVFTYERKAQRFW